MYRWLNHTGEAELALAAASVDGIFREAVAALRDLLGETGREATAGAVERDVALEAADGAALLADWISELAFLAETEGFVADRVERLELDGGRLRATLAGHTGDPPHLVKAVTYHGLSLAPHDRGWRASVVLDV